MRKEENKTTGELGLFFTKDDIKKIKYAGAGIGALLLLLVGTSIYSIYSMTSLQAQNELYRNQMKLAEQRMDDLVKKSQTVDKLSEQMQSMVNGNLSQTPATQDSLQNGQGGASTVPDVAANAAENNPVSSRVHTPGQLLNEMVALDNKLNHQIKKMIDLRSAAMTNLAGTVMPAGLGISTASTGSVTPDIWPVSGVVSSHFGFRISPGGIGSTYHEGLDIASSYGNPVHATANGRITQAGWVNGYGYLVEIDHGNGIKTRYGHNSAILVSVGDQVVQGQTISLIGSTGNSTGPHCHYEVRVNGEAVDPTLFLPTR
ncbi:MAG: M23 family metallopeptidase [Allisonella histaminiformans]|uniref:M23 family metallopeptidase n=1 Tax=Allisonella histaminiformans TaxID=209880 RepID=UPI002A82247A|nr:M23 family metallopeptidase [Allisonella histaminiformans]MDY4541051.1 M23 family metallopeptidase [Allisonella histaminiformans]